MSIQNKQSKILAINADDHWLNADTSILAEFFDTTVVSNDHYAIQTLTDSHQDFDFMVMMDAEPNSFLVSQFASDSVLQHIPIVSLADRSQQDRSLLSQYPNIVTCLARNDSVESQLRKLNRALSRSHNYIPTQLSAMEADSRQGDLTEVFSFTTVQQARQLAEQLVKRFDLADSVTLGLSEILINAIEHGNLAIDYQEKTRLLADNEWEQEMARRLKKNPYANRVAKLYIHKNSNELSFKVVDEGDGFDWQPYMSMSSEPLLEKHGRGIALAVALSFSKVTYHGKGNEVSLYL